MLRSDAECRSNRSQQPSERGLGRPPPRSTDEEVTNLHRRPLERERPARDRPGVGAGRRLQVVVIGMATELRTDDDARTPGYKWI
ncbi:hypothetical protein GCM10027446_26210 [Angustibacter peucedani]